MLMDDLGRLKNPDDKTFKGEVFGDFQVFLPQKLYFWYTIILLKHVIMLLGYDIGTYFESLD